MNSRQLTRRLQKGSFGGIIMAILIFGGFLSLGASLGPLYMDHNTMATILDKMSNEPGMGSKPDSMIYDDIKKRFRLNNIREFDIREHIKIDRSSAQGVTLIMDYEVRVPLVHNLDLIAHFYKKAILIG